MALIIQATDFASYKTLSQNINSTRDLDPYIKEAEEFDLLRIISQELMNDVKDAESSNATNNALLLAQIKPMMVYYSYMRYVQFRGVQDTQSGFRVKQGNETQAASHEERKAMYRDAKSKGLHYENILVAYLYENSAKFPLWKSTKTQKRSTTIRIRKV